VKSYSNEVPSAEKVKRMARPVLLLSIFNTVISILTLGIVLYYHL